MSGTMQDLTEARSRLHELGEKGKHEFSSMNRYLRLVRELGVRESEGVAEYGSVVLSTFRSKLQDDELWQLYEDVAIAAADTGCLKLAQQCVDAVNANFPASIRAKRLRGMLHEASGNLDEAKKIYDRILEDNPTNSIILKRKIALAVTSGDVTNAIDQLVAYLDTYQTDRQAWEQLSDLYMQVKLLDQARFCAEEVLVHGADIHSMLRVADMLYAQGGASNLQNALGYYCKVVELSHGANARALYGALGTVCELSGTKGYRKDHSQLATLAAQKLVDVYKKEAPSHVERVMALLRAQNVSL